MARSGSRRKQAQGDEGPGLEPVSGGKVRRMVFEGHRVSAGRSERKYIPRHTASMREIEREVDNLSASRRRAARAPPVEHDDTIYTTRSGRIEATEAPSPVAGRRRVLYLRNDDQGPVEGRRFSTVLVDELIKDVRLDRAANGSKASRKAAKKEKRSKKPAAKPAAKPEATSAEANGKTVVKPKSTARQPPVKPAADKSRNNAKKTDEAAQCAAVTAAGKQCRNSARSGSKYCSSHKGYRPQQLEAHLQRQRTKPARASTKDTAPGEKVDAAQTVQCVALTKGGKQCRNSSRKGSPYCSSHKGYRGERADVLAAMDTLPRNKKAKDTKPSVKK